MTSVCITAHAKLNLTLDVVGRRGDGFHELRGVFARISLTDDVRVARSRVWRVAIRPPVDVRPDLAERAARELARRIGRGDAASIVIRKRIPAASGLGGGSSDAAHVLRALARLWRVEPDAIASVASETGSDIPFFLDGALAEVRGRGELVRALTGGPWWGVVVLFGVRVSTADAFARLAPTDWSRGERTARLVRALESGGLDPRTLREMCGNDLDKVASTLCPAIAVLRERVAPTPLFVSGSGPTLFAVADDRGDALAIRRRIRRNETRALVVRIGVETQTS